MTDVDSVRVVLAGIQQRADAATKGPWAAEPDTGAGRVWVQRGPRHHGQDCEPLFAFRDLRTSQFDREALRASFAQREADAAFIASARTDTPLLVAALTAVLDLADELYPGAATYSYVTTQIRERVASALGVER